MQRELGLLFLLYTVLTCGKKGASFARDTCFHQPLCHETSEGTELSPAITTNAFPAELSIASLDHVVDVQASTAHQADTGTFSFSS